MTTVDFTSWASPNLDLVLGGRTYSVRPPSVAAARLMVALTVQEEIRYGLVKGTMPDDLAALIAERSAESFESLTLTPDVYDRMVADGLPERDIARMAYYALHYWTRGKTRADWFAERIFVVPADREAAEPAPKARRRSRSGQPSASANRTRTASTPTTGSPSS